MLKLTKKQKQELQESINRAKAEISAISMSEAFNQIEYSPDLTLGDSVAALEYLEWELHR
ncbi:hypothetical protein PN459_21545 [Microcystis aeruginosa CS-567/02-A1]|uniref:hypothetical protein n=1 Tax=Microcystis aeruginosa TaxID=1126 RepID=UPI0023307FE5|nr:hypothetical protein [Microcystis aeruginosa]MDB9402540.1 hypothetical protein [Microcystis aeruginosa CS-567/02-A1]